MAHERNWITAVAATAALATAAAVAWWWRETRPPTAPAAVAPASAAATTTAGASRPPPPVAATTDGTGVAVTAPATAPAAADPAVAAKLQDFQRLAAMPAGDAAIELGQQIEASITPQNMPAYVETLLSTNHPGAERAALTALARAGDGQAMQALAAAYGRTPPEHRGRILQALEGARDPSALPGLLAVVSADRGEKRSPVTMSALYGVAGIGTMDSVDALLRRMTAGSEDYVLMALERVQTPQGIAMIRAAAQGAKGSEHIDPALRPALLRIARAAEAAGGR